MKPLKEQKRKSLLRAEPANNKLHSVYMLNYRYLDDLLNIDNPYFEGMVNRIHPPELQLNK